MFRKTLLTLAALAAVGTAAFTVAAPTVANANNWHNHRNNHHHHWRPSIRYSAPAYNAYGSCYVRRVIHTAYGPRVTWTNICY
jgi:hypothetical protein